MEKFQVENNKSRRKFKKLVSYSEGENNKDKIFKFIAKHLDSGVSAKEIINEKIVKKSDVYLHLKELISEKRIYKKNKKYFTENSGSNSINLFAHFLKEESLRVFDAALIEPSEKNVKFINTISTPHGELLKKVYGISISNNFCNTEFIAKENLNEKCMFEFVNRIGAIMVYTFIEAMRPIVEKKNNIATSSMSHEKRILASSDLVHTAIDIDKIFRHFYFLFKQTGLLKNMTIDPRREDGNLFSELYSKLEKDDFDTLSDLFKRVYPGIHEGLENFWQTSRQEWLKMHTSFALTENCNHKWNKTFIHKYKVPCGLCRKCHLLVDFSFLSKIKNEKEIRNDKNRPTAISDKENHDKDNVVAYKQYSSLIKKSQQEIEEAAAQIHNNAI
jgi:hypothetical protein